MDKKAANIIKYSLSAALAAVLVWLAFRGVDWKAFWAGLQQTRWLYMVLFFVAATLALVFREERWRALMHPLDPEIRRLPVWDAINIGNLVNVVLPGAGEFVRCGYVRSKHMSYDKALGTIACERVFDVIMVFLLILVALVLKWESFGTFFVESVWQPMAGRLGGSLGWVLAGSWRCSQCWSGRCSVSGRASRCSSASPAPSGASRRASPASRRWSGSGPSCSAPWASGPCTC